MSWEKQISPRWHTFTDRWTNGKFTWQDIQVFVADKFDKSMWEKCNRKNEEILPWRI